ncbi:RNA polymerase sigma factor [Aestuariibacter salexigens]|uniref:RNA polymerase sigma factor n=1 Tax=Aestuariibacter salexigens TaxID=226010 RepID=UPI00040967EB|nr:sigma-70 family RNA polymerase sigma factor [Aestuariibacter salexigens]
MPLTAQCQQQFEQWMSSHQGLIYKVIRAYTSTRADQDDLYQDIAAQIWRSMASFKGQSKVSTWMYKVALFTAMNWSKQHQKHGVADDNVDPVELSAPSSGNDKLDWLYAQLHTLNEVDRSILLLTLDGFDYAQLANILGMTANAVGVRLNRIKKRLAQST